MRNVTERLKFKHQNEILRVKNATDSINSRIKHKKESVNLKRAYLKMYNQRRKIEWKGSKKVCRIYGIKRANAQFIDVHKREEKDKKVESLFK